MSTDPISVIGVVTTCKRPATLRTLLGSLKEAGPLRKVIVVDNGPDAETETLCREQPFPVLYDRPGRNLGCGGGIGRGLMLGSQDPGVTHFCCFDDDAYATPGAVEALVGGMIAAEADLAVPLILNAEGYISWPPGLLERQPWHALLRGRLAPAQYRAAFGLGPVPFSWAPWMTLALSASVVRECGYPRDDFWLGAEDLEYTLRLTYRHRGVLVPAAVCCHVPPPMPGGNDLGGPHYLKHCLMLENLSYMTTRLPHARRILRHLPGNYWRFVRTFGCNAATVRDGWLAWWRGAVRGKPAGIAGDSWKEKMSEAYMGQRAANPPASPAATVSNTE
jgi:glycosyltransferase involved in cell wall biosynthesis